jgi:hypothetical protein
MSKYLDAYPEEKKKNVEAHVGPRMACSVLLSVAPPRRVRACSPVSPGLKAVLNGEKNIVTLLRHISTEISRQKSLPSMDDASRMKAPRLLPCAPPSSCRGL